ncbi:MAG: xanthine dehydrogenase accessory factor [Reinekea sp.]|jgi:xanthine dehydrogenase accessory factor
MTQSVTVRVVKTQGSAPRDAGTVMQVFIDTQNGTIGGGALEWEATRIARTMLTGPKNQMLRVFPLGPDLGQCCGGAVTLAFDRDVALGQANRQPVWIWGAGHVGRAIAGVLQPTEAFDITLIDTSASKLPDPMPQGVTPLVATDPVRVIPHAPENADHLVLTHSHDIDLALCDGLLRHSVGSIGLIGSHTKWVRFQRRLGALGHTGGEISRIQCPIGDPALGKHPHAIAIGVAAAMIRPDQTARKDKIA